MRFGSPSTSRGPSNIHPTLLIETNGLGLGVYGEGVTTILAAAGSSLMVRLCLKGVSPQSFEKVTGQKWFPLVLRGIAALREANIPYQVAVMDKLLERERPDAEVSLLLRSIPLEIEQLNCRYAGVKARLASRGLQW